MVAVERGRCELFFEKTLTRLTMKDVTTVLVNSSSATRVLHLIHCVEELEKSCLLSLTPKSITKVNKKCILMLHT